MVDCDGVGQAYLYPLSGYFPVQTGALSDLESGGTVVGVGPTTTQGPFPARWKCGVSELHKLPGYGPHPRVRTWSLV